MVVSVAAVATGLVARLWPCVQARRILVARLGEGSAGAEEQASLDVPVPDITQAVADMQTLFAQMDEDSGLYMPLDVHVESEAAVDYLETRDSLVGTIPSSELLRLDEENGMWPLE